ncbi:LysE family translocator [Inquilinus sp.]|uniref:LysE family translocator n=1 Tax=Inquilinus sp. TaxID=1932117 RepID=UPI0031D74B03
MNGTLLLASGLAGFAYGISPGPAVLALLGISAGQGRKAGATFLCGHLVGDALWSALALTAIIGAQAIGPVVFDALGLICGGYLLWLGWSALTVRRGSDGSLDRSVNRPLLRGLLFGVTNPKGYPVAVATFTALLTSYAASLSWSALPALVVAACVGSATAYVILVGVTGTSGVRRFYRRREIWFVRASGLLFLGFALHALTQSIGGLAARRG